MFNAILYSCLCKSSFYIFDVPINYDFFYINGVVQSAFKVRHSGFSFLFKILSYGRGKGGIPTFTFDSISQYDHSLVDCTCAQLYKQIYYISSMYLLNNKCHLIILQLYYITQ